MTQSEYELRVAALKARYAFLFSGKNIGHDILPGWIAIIEELCARIDETLTAAEKPTVHFLQIKDKMGGLRTYLNIAPLRIDIMGNGGRYVSGYLRKEEPPGIFARIGPFISAAEAKSFQTCCFCGAPGKLRDSDFWLLTLCDKHEPFSYRDLRDRFDELTVP